MNTIRTLSLVLASTCALALHAAEEAVGPKGGRLLAKSPVATEFFVNADRKVEINFYDASGKPAAPESRVVDVIAEPKGKRTPLALEKTQTGYTSTTALPEGEPYRVVVQVRDNANARPQNYRVQLNLENCAECDHPEYACTCGH